MNAKEVVEIYRQCVEDLPIGVTLEFDVVGGLNAERVIFTAQEAGYSYCHRSHWDKLWRSAMGRGNHLAHWKTLRGAKMAWLREIGWAK